MNRSFEWYYIRVAGLLCRTACHVHVRAGVERGLPPPARVHALVHLLERARNRGAGSGRRPCEWATVLWSAAPLFFSSSIGMQAEAGQRVSGRREAEEQQSAREMGEVWKRLRNRTPTDNSRRNLICRSVNQISREMRALETDPVLDNSPYGKSVTADALTESYGFGGEWKNSVWITIILKTSLILRENLKLGEITLSDILDHCLITKYRASIFIYIYSQEH